MFEFQVDLRTLPDMYELSKTLKQQGPSIYVYQHNFKN